MERSVYLWSDDNLSNDFLWQYLDIEERNRLASFENYGRVGCFKGFDANSFAFNTGAEEAMFKVQFRTMRKLIETRLDVYGYVTLTSLRDAHLRRRMSDFDVEAGSARMAPDVPIAVAPTEKLFSVIDPKRGVVCPKCDYSALVKLGKGTNKKVELSLLVHPQWLAGSPRAGSDGQPFGGSAQDDAASTTRWNDARASQIRLLEIRGELPEVVTCPQTGVTFATGKKGGTVPKKSNYACAKCGTVQDVLATVKASHKTGPMAAYAVQGYAPYQQEHDAPYNGRFFAPFDLQLARQYDAALKEWEARKDTDLRAYWPRSSVPYGFMTGIANGDIREGHGFTHWSMMFNPRQLLVHAQIFKAILTLGVYDWDIREYVLGAFQQYLRNQSLFTLWNVGADKLEPMFANNNYHPKSTVVENCVFAQLGRGNWTSCTDGIIEGREWALQPWETVSVEMLKRSEARLGALCSGKSEKTKVGDVLGDAVFMQGSATDLSSIQSEQYDLIVTDPPFGGLLHYSELADFFYVWLRLGLKERYPDIFGAELTPKTLEVVANRAREPENPEGFYQRLLTQCWREACRILKPAGMLAFTFHHSEDEPWVAVLEALFDAGFYLEASYPIRSDETKGEGEFGSKKIEYDIVHVCRKRIEEPKPVSWARMRREVMQDVRQIQQLLENHAKQGLPEADIQVIKRGKALEYFSRHYGKVYVDEDRTISVKDALVGINQLIDESGARGQEPPPVTAEPITRQFLRIFDGTTSLPRDQVQKYLRGSGMAPEEFEERGWCHEEQKTYHLVSPLELARAWTGRHRRNMTSDYDQAMYLIGACYDGSGINASDTLNNENFRPHPALKPLMEWHAKRAARQDIRNAATRAVAIYQGWERSHQDQLKRQLSFFEDN